MSCTRPFTAQAFFYTALLSGSLAGAQPTLSVTKTNSPCSASAQPDTIVAPADADGFRPLFDGKTLKGWWENCQTTHSSQDAANGGFWIADSVNGAIYSQQAGNFAGSVLMTNKSYEHYELIFDFWPTFGNDAGVFNRVVPSGSTAGRTFQTGIDYKEGSSIGGAYGEGGYGGSPAFNHDPYKFSSTTVRTSMTIDNWTTFTAARNPESFGCPTTGCTAAHWTTVFDTGGWNQMRVKFYGGLTSATRTKMQAWLRRVSNPPGTGPDRWVPTYDSSQAVVTPANPIGLQIHGGSGYWSQAGKGTWYRNIKIRPLDEQGVPLPPTGLRGSAAPRRADLRVVSGALEGILDARHEITLSDLSGRVVQRFQGSAGAVRYPLAARGVLFVTIRLEGEDARSLTAVRL
jgi:hypothetical protein